MARGWESKVVEDQIDEADRVEITAKSAPLTTESFEIELRRENLRLTRSNLVQQLSRARTVVHRQMVHQALREIDEQLKKFGS